MSKPSYYLVISAILLYAIGLVMVFDTTSAEFLDKGHIERVYQAFLKQSLYSLAGISLGLIVYRAGYEGLMKRLPILFILVTISLLLVFIPGIGQSINGARRWVQLFGISFQPSEFAKFIIPLYLYSLLKKEKKLTFKSFFKCCLIVLAPILLILIEPDNGTTFILFISFMALFVLMRIRPIYWVLPACVLVVFGGIFAYNMPHVPDRIQVYLHPELDLQGKGHQPYQAKIAAGSGGLFGRGPGESIQKFNYLPEARSDYIAAIFAEEFGFLGVLFLIALYLTFTISGCLLAIHAKKREGFFIASIITFMISFQAFLNLGVVSNLLPSKGTTLPFISQGGSSLIANLMALFLLMNISKAALKTKRAL